MEYLMRVSLTFLCTVICVFTFTVTPYTRNTFRTVGLLHPHILSPGIAITTTPVCSHDVCVERQELSGLTMTYTSCLDVGRPNCGASVCATSLLPYSLWVDLIPCDCVKLTCRKTRSEPDHGFSGPWGLRATAGPLCIYLQYWLYFSSNCAITFFA